MCLFGKKFDLGTKNFAVVPKRDWCSILNFNLNLIEIKNLQLKSQISLLTKFWGLDTSWNNPKVLCSKIKLLSIFHNFAVMDLDFTNSIKIELSIR